MEVHGHLCFMEKWRNLSHRIGSNKKQSKQSMNADNKLLETVFVIAICCLSDYKQQSKILLLTIFNYVRRQH